MRNHGFKVLFILIVLLLTGCMEYEDRMALEWDQSAVLTLTMGVSETFVDDDSALTEEELWEELNQVEAVSPEWVSVYYDGGYQWAEAFVTISDVNALHAGAAESFPMLGQMEWYEQDGIWHFRRTVGLVEDAPDELTEPGADEFRSLFAASIRWEFTVEFPGDVLQANTAARNIDHSTNTVTWSISLASLMAESHVMTAEITQTAGQVTDACSTPPCERPEVDVPSPVGDTSSVVPVEDWWVLKANSNEDVDRLLQEGVDVNERDASRRTPLMYFASRPDATPAIELLLEQGADVHARSIEGLTALMYAVRDDASTETVSALLAAGSPLDARTEAGESALSLAILYEADRDVVGLLLQYGANPNSRQIDGLTPLLQAAYASFDPEVVSLLLDNGADPLLTHNGASAVIVAAAFNPQTEILARLLASDAELDRHQADGLPLLMWAVLNPNADAARLVIEAGADVHQRLPDGTTVLMYAAERASNPAVLDLLLEAGADGTLKNDRGLTAFDLAKNNSRIHGTDAYWRLNDARFQVK